MVSHNISIYTILFKTAYQAVLLIVYHFYGCLLNYFLMVLIYTYSYICRTDFLEQLRSLKTNGAGKNVRSFFFILKPKYVEDLTLYLSD
jgi:hypothetical protein